MWVFCHYFGMSRPITIQPKNQGGAAVLSWLSAHRVSMSDLAKSIGLSRWTLSKIVSGGQDPSYRVAVMLDRMGAAPFTSWCNDVT
jgi:plasmid maintenance system antidote protein VapI